MRDEIFLTVPEQGSISEIKKKEIGKSLNQYRGKRVRIIIEKLKSKRTHDQNSLWWVYMTILSKETGYSKDEIHEICKFMFLKTQKVDEKTGLVFEYLRSTTDLSISEFSEMIEQLFQWAAETLNCVLPDSNNN